MTENVWEILNRIYSSPTQELLGPSDLDDLVRSPSSSIFSSVFPVEYDPSRVPPQHQGGTSHPVFLVEDDSYQLRDEPDIFVQSRKPPILMMMTAEDIKLTSRQAIDKIVDDAEERILALEEDWDGQGSPAFKKQTLDAIRDFLLELVDGSELSVVKQVWIVPFSGGSIDLQWQAEHFDLLINFCTDGNVTYYGKDTYGHSIRGDSRPKPGYISCWMSHASR